MTAKLKTLAKDFLPAAVVRVLRSVQSQRQPNFTERGFNAFLDFHRTLGGNISVPNELRQFFDKRTEGHGIWKWLHYFDIYDRHFKSFRGRDVHILEIGVYSGGSLDMWKHYFGPRSHIYGVDIEPACKKYEMGNTRIFIGDQGSRSFWKEFKSKVQLLDIVVDDGSHTPEDQITTLESLLPHLRPGGVYLCEDAHGSSNAFMQYIHGMSQRLHAMDRLSSNEDCNERRLVCQPTEFQSNVSSIHLYPFVAVIERSATAPSELIAPKHGSCWEPHNK